MRTENKMNEISSTECAVEAHAVRLIICTNTFFCSRRIRYAYAVKSLRLNEKYFVEQRFGSQSMLSY